jgi:DNA-binding NtrC family response regulator
MDFAAKYNVPRIELEESARMALLNYTWPGNIRQLKNVAEQVSILELNRRVDGDVMSRYLPEQPKNNLPMLAGQQGGDRKTFESEREILYSVLFDMRRDIAELKNQIENMRSPEKESNEGVQYYGSSQEMPDVMHRTLHIQTPVQQFAQADSLVDEYIEETLSLDDVERKTILMALERNRGKRRNAAKELNISERTLYRKIKEYGIE